MGELSLSTLLLSLKAKSSYELRTYAKKQFESKYGTEDADTISKLMNEHASKKKEVLFSKLRTSESIPPDEMEALISLITEASSKRTFPIGCIMEMYRSGNEFLIKESKGIAISKNERFIHDIIHKNYPTYASGYGDELYQCGVIGLIKAMERYDESKGAFTTYCRFFIMHEMSDQVNFHRNNTTVHYNNLQKKINEAVTELKNKGKYQPTVKDIAFYTGLKPETVKRELQYSERTRFIYMDTFETDTEKDKIANKSIYADSPDKIVEQKEKERALSESMNTLPYPIKEVLVLRFIEGDTNDCIAKKLGISIGQVKTYAQKGLRMLRHDKKLCYAYQDHLSSAERDMLKYSLPVAPSSKSADEMIEEVIPIFNTFSHNA